MTTDFAQLYLQLGIRNDCSLEEFKQACRRRIRQQHPDRLEVGNHWNTTQLPLTELLALYAKALRFHRRHGRLPGAAAANPAVNTSLRPSTLAHTRAHTTAITSTPTPRRISLRIPVLILATTLIGFAVASAWDGEDTAAEASTSSDDSTPPGSAETSQFQAAAESIPPQAVDIQQDGQPVVAPPRLIEIGMDAETVRSIQGDPVQWEGSEWIYGPSWIRFERGRVIDWYSSPLHRLKTETASP